MFNSCSNQCLCGEETAGTSYSTAILHISPPHPRHESQVRSLGCQGQVVLVRKQLTELELPSSLSHASSKLPTCSPLSCQPRDLLLLPAGCKSPSLGDRAFTVSFPVLLCGTGHSCKLSTKNAGEGWKMEDDVVLSI